MLTLHFHEFKKEYVFMENTDNIPANLTKLICLIKDTILLGFPYFCLNFTKLVTKKWHTKAKTGLNEVNCACAR